VTAPPAERLERRVLVVAPVGKDAALIASMLRRETIETHICAGFDDLVQELARGAAAVLLAEEAMTGPERRLGDAVAQQPPWSDLPILVLTRPGADSAAVGRALHSFGNVTLLERPVRVGALGSAIRSALRARERQYQTRAYLAERQQADERKDRFLATLAHELRNPLAPIRNSMSLLRLAGGGENADAIYGILERQIDHMVRLVDDLMEVSRITRGKIELRKAPVDLAESIAVAVETSRPLIDAAQHDLQVSLPDERMVLQADGMRLAQVFSNLLNNAAKYTDAGGRIAIAARREGHAAVVTVSDNGVGIPADALPRVFEMFAQVDAGDSRAQTGLGIGLTIVRSLVEMHGGSVVATSAGPGRGSEFVVRLPLADRPRERASSGARTAPADRTLPRVLLVDDNHDAADTLGALLQMLGAEVQVVYDGPSALDAIAAFRPSVVVLDLGMPGMDGYEVARRVREHHPKLPVLIALTGWGQERDRQLTAAAGFEHHLVKPVGLDTLKTVLASVPS
jgi:signal transduction histidine kinase